MKVRDLEVKETGTKHLVTVWDNACVYCKFEVGQMIKMRDVITGFNKFLQRNHVVIRFEDQIQVNIL